MKKHTLGIDIGSTTVKIAILDENDTLVFSDYERHFANIQETLADLLQKAEDQLGELHDEFYYDEDALQELIIKLFYREI